jgi:hypothetical protein
LVRWPTSSLVEYHNRGSPPPSLTPVALHARLIGQPGRFQALKNIVETLSANPDVWFATREEIARQWVSQYPDPFKA